MLRKKRWAMWLPVLFPAIATPGPAQSADRAHTRPAPVSATPEAVIDRLLQPEYRDLREAILRALQEPDPTDGIRKIDPLLALIETGSPIATLLTSRKAALTVSAGRTREGRIAFERLLERHPRVHAIKLIAIDSLAYTAEADFAARQWIELAARAPVAARTIGGYTLGALVGNLEAGGDIDGLVALCLALERIGYDPGSVALRDRMQLAIFVNAANDSGREQQARTALDKVADPVERIAIAAQARFRDYWPRIELDPAALDALGANYLEQLRQDFLRADNGTAAGAYLGAAASLTEPRATAGAYTRLLDRLFEVSPESLYTRYDTPFWVAPLASAWTAAGSPDEAEELFVTALDRYSAITGTNPLNITANYALDLLERDRPREALALIEPAIAELAAAGQSLGALGKMHAVRLRAYHRLGQAEVAADSRRHLEEARSTQLATYANTMLALGEDEAAKTVLIANLRSADPEQGIRYLQHPVVELRTASTAANQADIDRMRQDGEVMAALDRVGRILDKVSIGVADYDHAAVAQAFPLRR